MIKRKILMTSQPFQLKTKKKTGRIYGWSQSRRINRSMGSCKRITTKIPPLFDGSTSWCKYEELIDDWLDLTVLQARKRGPALKNRHVGDAEMHKGLLDREPLRAADGVKCFRDTWRPHFIKGARGVFFWRFISVHEQEEETSRWSSGSASFHCF